MDNRFLNKVLDQIVRETEIDYSMEEIQFPFTSLPLPFSSFLSFYFSFLLFMFTKHCKTVYGLKGIEVEYVWKKYIKIIKNKIRNNG